MVDNMKRYINYYYGLDIKQIVLNKNRYVIISDNDTYIFEKSRFSFFEEYYSFLEQELEKYKYFSRIIKNRFNRAITIINGVPYILLKVEKAMMEKISIFDIKDNLCVENEKILNRIVHFPWDRLWSEKIDYMEEWLESKKDSYIQLYPIFKYYIGLSENALLYFKKVNDDNFSNLNKSFQHYRLRFDSELCDYYDPTNIIIDYKCRDISEYIKSVALEDKVDINILNNYIIKNNYNVIDLQYLYSRMLFPSFFFDYIEDKIMNNDNIEAEYLEKIGYKYERFIKEISQYLKNVYNIAIVDWAIKKA